MNNAQKNTPRDAEKAVTKPIHIEARGRIKQYVDDFATTLILVAKVLAYKEKAEIVLQRHVDESLTYILSQKKRDWMREFLKILGGSLIGAFVPGLITSLPTHDVLATVIYIGLGFSGIIMVFVGLAI